MAAYGKRSGRQLVEHHIITSRRHSAPAVTMNTHLSAVPRPSACARRFVVVTTDDLPEAYFVLDHLLSRHQDVALLNVRGRPWGNRLRIMRRLHRRHGARYLVELMMGRLLRSRYQAEEYSPFPEIDRAALARIRSIVPVHDTPDPHGREALAFVRARQPDYLLIAGAPVLRRELYSLARHGALNRHLGLSPHYRGSDCPLWALAAGDPERIGYTIHRVDDRVDGGERLLQRRVRLVAGEELGETLARINRSGSEGFIEVLDAILDGDVLDEQPQDRGGRHYPPAPLSILRRASAEHARLTDPSERTPRA